MNGWAYKTNTPNTTHEYTLTPEIYNKTKQLGSFTEQRRSIRRRKPLGSSMHGKKDSLTPFAPRIRACKLMSNMIVAYFIKGIKRTRKNRKVIMEWEKNARIQVWYILF